MMKLRLPRCLALVLVVLLTGPVTAGAAAAEAPSPETLAEGLHRFYREVESLGFTFIQSTSGQMGGRAKTGRGDGLYARTADQPLMRWNYLAPDFQVVISDGATLSMYFEKLNQMIVSEMDEDQADILFAFFAAAEPLDRLFEVLPPLLETDLSEAPAPDLHILRLQPRDTDSQVKTIHLWIGADWLVRRIELVDHFDTRTVITLSNITINPLDVSDRDDLRRRFTFTPPEGTEIIRQ